MASDLPAMTVALALPWLVVVVIGRVFGRLDLRNVDRALPTCIHIAQGRVLIDSSIAVHLQSHVQGQRNDAYTSETYVLLSKGSFVGNKTNLLC